MFEVHGDYEKYCEGLMIIIRKYIRLRSDKGGAINLDTHGGREGI